jgi:Cu2+-exporting ATPase
VINLGDQATGDLAVALALASASSHPLSVSLTAAARAAGVVAADVAEITEVPGYGTRGSWNGRQVCLGRATWLGAPDSAETTAWLKLGDSAPIAFRYTDRLRPGAAEAVAELQRMGKRVCVMSGDNTGAVATLAKRLNITDWTAEALPLEKSNRIAEMTAAGARVLMVGDGLNDTAALAAAHVSISPASALDAARVASDIVLLGNDLSPIPLALATARSATRRIRENFQIATLYNVVAVPLAVIGLATPLIAALAMSTSSITVSLNALRLR